MQLPTIARVHETCMDDGVSKDSSPAVVSVIILQPVSGQHSICAKATKALLADMAQSFKVEKPCILPQGHLQPVT